MTGITDITFLHSLITVSYFLKALEKESNKTTSIWVETNETENFNILQSADTLLARRAIFPPQ